MSTITQDWNLIIQHDPLLTKFPHRTSQDLRRLADEIGISRHRVHRAFNARYFCRTRYLLKSLDPLFEPHQHIRERAAIWLLGGRPTPKQKRKPNTQAVKSIIPPQPPKQKKQPSRFSRYTF